jgi:hypothetical protein
MVLGDRVGRAVFTLALALIAVALVILSAVPFVTATILTLPTNALYGGISIFANRIRTEALARIVVATACIIIIPTLGLIDVHWRVQIHCRSPALCHKPI